MLASEDAAAVGRLMAERFGLPLWQFAMTRTDANRFVLRWVRAATSRKVLLVFNGCYHGTVDDVFVDLVDGRAVQRDSLLGQVHALTGPPVSWSSMTSSRWRRRWRRATWRACWPSR